MASNQSSSFQQRISKYPTDKMALIIEKLAGGKDNLHVDIQDLKFNLAGNHFEVDGQINFNVVHRKGQSHPIEG